MILSLILQGWLCKKTIEHFENYSRFCYQTFGDRVKYWITLNEPAVFSDAGHNYCEMAPGICGGNELGRQARHNSLLAHAKAYRVYENEFKTQQKGQCGITLNSGYSQPEDPNNEKDVLASETAMSLYLGWWADPIYKAGDYSQVMKDALNRESEWNIYYELSEAEKNEIKGSSDFFGLNHYGSDIVRWNDDSPYGVEVGSIFTFQKNIFKSSTCPVAKNGRLLAQHGCSQSHGHSEVCSTLSTRTTTLNSSPFSSLKTGCLHVTQPEPALETALIWRPI